MLARMTLILLQISEYHPNQKFQPVSAHRLISNASKLANGYLKRTTKTAFCDSGFYTLNFGSLERQIHGFDHVAMLGAPSRGQE
jgi:hypothetical protein